jgi:CRISPR-associated protein Cas2
MIFGGTRTVWVVVLFDLPVTTPETRKAYTEFRKALLADGFTMMQFSVYMRHCASEENAQVHIDRTRKAIPPEGEVRIVKITDKQFSRIQIFLGKRRKKPENVPRQLTLF